MIAFHYSFSVSWPPSSLHGSLPLYTSYSWGRGFSFSLDSRPLLSTRAALPTLLDLSSRLPPWYFKSNRISSKSAILPSPPAPRAGFCFFIEEVILFLPQNRIFYHILSLGLLEFHFKLHMPKSEPLISHSKPFHTQPSPSQFMAAPSFQLFKPRIFQSSSSPFFHILWAVSPRYIQYSTTSHHLHCD